MRKIVVLLLLSLFILMGANAQTRILTDTEKIVGLSKLWEGVRSNFVYYDQMKIDWDSLYEASIPEVLEIEDTYSYLRKLESIAALAKDGHTFVYHGVEPEWENRIMPAPFTVKYVEGKILVDKIWSSFLVDAGVKRGTEVVSINNIEVRKYIEEVLGRYISSSTPQWLYYMALKGGYELTKGHRNDSLVIDFKNERRVFSLNIDRKIEWDIDKDLRQQQQKEYYNKATMTLDVLEDNIGLLTIRHFNDQDMNKLFDSIYEKVLPLDGLIIDLRNNEGGNSSYADYILRHLADKPIKTGEWSSRMYIPAHASWDYPAEWYTRSSGYLKPVDKEIYRKPIIVMVNAGTFSSSEDFCVRFRGMKRGRIIGTPTGGSTGNGVTITLIEGLAWVNVCAKKDIAPDGSVFVGVGVLPDIEVADTKESFLENKDAVLERAVLEIDREMTRE